MKATGVVRRIDDLGRVVIPKEIRRTLRIREGDPLEIFVDRSGEIILKKYSPIGELSDFAKEYVDSIYEVTGHAVLVTDRDAVVAVAGVPKKEFLDRPISPAVEGVMDRRTALMIEGPGKEPGGEPFKILADDEDARFTAQVIAPIVVQGDPIGTVIVASKTPGVRFGQVEQKIAETAAIFLGKQMED